MKNNLIFYILVINSELFYIKKYVRIIRCYRCNCYGHMTNDCKFDEHCAKCSNRHDSRECNSVNLTCINCKSLNDKSVDCNHSADSPKCQVYRNLLRQDKDFPTFIRKDLVDKN